MIERMVCFGELSPRFACGLLAIGFLGACNKAAPEEPRRTATEVPVAVAQRGGVSPSSILGGIIVPYQNVQLQSTLIEPANSVNVNEGDRVTRGEVLAVLDTRDLQAELRSDVGTASSNAAKAQQSFDQASLTIAQNDNTVIAARSTVRSAQATLATAQLNLRRDAQLLRDGYISQQTYDLQNTQVKIDISALASARITVVNDRKQVEANGTTATGLQGATVAAARAAEQTALGQADNIRVSIAKATIASPIDGVVVNRNLNTGEYPGSRQIFTLQETDKVYAALNGSGSQVIGVRTGAPVAVMSSDRPDIKAAGTVVGVLDEVTPGSTNFVVKVLVPNPTGALHSGMVVAGRVTRPSTNGVRIPVTAFLDTTNSTVQIISNGTVKTTNVTMLASDSKNAIVAGLRIGTQVIANGQLGLSDGQNVQARKNAVAQR